MVDTRLLYHMDDSPGAVLVQCILHDVCISPCSTIPYLHVSNPCSFSYAMVINTDRVASPFVLYLRVRESYMMPEILRDCFLLVRYS